MSQSQLFGDLLHFPLFQQGKIGVDLTLLMRVIYADVGCLRFQIAQGSSIC
jgi:hypothetical protein